MENVSYIGLSQQLAIQQQMEMTASNIANMSTPGFKAQAALFSDYLNTPKGGAAIKQVQNSGSYRDLSPGSMAQTFNTFDVAIQGEGYFAIETANGTRYTRDGGFSMNSERELVTKSGDRVMGDGGGAIVIPPEVTNVTITPTGDISGNEGVISRLKIVTFDNEQMLKRAGGNLYEADGAAEIAIETPRVAQGALEQSNVNPILEMNKMIELLRLFQASQKILQNDHDRIRGMIEKLTRA